MDSNAVKIVILLVAVFAFARGAVAIEKECHTCQCLGTCVTTPVPVQISGPPTKPGQTGIMIPWYEYFDANVLINVHNYHPSVPMILIDGYTNYTKIRAAGIKVICYVDTGFGSFSISSVESGIDGCVGNVDGVFFDDFVGDSGHVSYYNTLGSYAKSKGLSITVGNPGGPIQSTYTGIDIINVYEDYGLPASISCRQACSILPHNVPGPLNTNFMSAVSGVINYVYITDCPNTNCWAVPASYFMQEVAALDKNPPQCPPIGWKCKDASTLAYQNADCSWSNSQVCQNGCSNGQCNSCSSGTIPAPKTDATCNSWSQLSSGGATSSSSAIDSSGSTLVIATPGTDNRIYIKEWNTTSKSLLKDWYALPGSTSTAPKLISNSTGIYLYVQGNDGRIYYSIYQGTGSWTPFASTGICNSNFGSSGPASVSASDGNIYGISGTNPIVLSECGGPTTTMTITLNQGWNMISLPVSPTSQTQSNCQTISPIWHYNPSTHAYDQISALSQSTAGSGYWIKISNDCTITSSGSAISITDLPTLSSGWNQIGTSTQSVTFQNVVGNCNVISGPWKYNPQTNQYEQSQTLEPGKGYWIKVAGTCNLGS